MDKRAIYAMLARRGVWHEAMEHAAVFNMAEASALTLPYPEAEAKNLFLRDDRRQDYCLVTVRGDKRVDLKAFRRAQGTRPLRFATEEELAALLGLAPGAVTPLGLLNDGERRVRWVVDSAFWEEPGLIGVHPNDNTATVWLRADDLLALIREHGNEARVVKL